MARELEGNWTRFTPHYIVWVCPESYRASDECQSQCIHNGRYCTPDPDGDLQAGYSGRDIVQVRSLCCALPAGLLASLQPLQCLQRLLPPPSPSGGLAPACQHRQDWHGCLQQAWLARAQLIDLCSLAG